jgi:co-chaperonin GroES (HSP10)
MKKRIQATRDYVVIHPDMPMRTSPQGFIVIPETADDNNNPPSGVVVSVGSGLVESGVVVPLTVKVGQRVYLPRNAGTLIRNHPIIEDCFIVRENQIFGWDYQIEDTEPPAFKMDSGPGLTLISNLIDVSSIS